MLFFLSLTLSFILAFVLFRIPSCPAVYVAYVAYGLVRDVWMAVESRSEGYADAYRLALVPTLLIIGCIVVRACAWPRMWPLCIVGAALAAAMWYAEGSHLWSLEAGVYAAGGIVMLLSLARKHSVEETKILLFLGLYFISRGALLYAYIPLAWSRYWRERVLSHASELFHIPEIALIALLIVSLRPQMDSQRGLDSHAAATIPRVPQEVLRSIVPLTTKDAP